MIQKLSAGADKSVVAEFEDAYFWVNFARTTMTAVAALVFVEGYYDYLAGLVPFVGARAYEIALYHNLSEWYHSLKREEKLIN